MLRRKKEGLHVKILASYMELSTQLSMVLGSIKELNRMILLEFSTRGKTIFTWNFQIQIFVDCLLYAERGSKVV